jgi:hypothetical protein
MLKRYSIAMCAIAILMGLGLVAAVGAPSRPASSVRSHPDPVKLVTLILTFADGQWAKVTGVEGGTIRIEQNGNALTLTPEVVNKANRTVELKVSRIVRSLERESLQAVESFVVGSDPTDLEVGGMSFTVQVKKARKVLPTTQAIRQCCVTDCEGRLICGVCVCTPCGVCSAYNWCDCPAPGPAN